MTTEFCEICITMPLFPREHRGGARDCAHKIHEEAAEAMVEACAWAETGGGREVMLDELADVFQALANFVYAFQVTGEELSDAVVRCVERNHARGRYDVDE